MSEVEVMSALMEYDAMGWAYSQPVQRGRMKVVENRDRTHYYARL